MNSKLAAIFRHYPNQPANSLLFPGCYFPAFFPHATRALYELAAQHGTACAFDCCGKPQQKTGRHIQEQIQRLQVQELITVCPNCSQHLQGNLPVRMRSIYEKLAEWGIMRQDAADGQVFIPCPDRRDKALLQQIGQLLPNYHLAPIKSIPCCGLGKGFTYNKSIEQQLNGTLYTYCASCAGQFQRKGIQPVHHLLAEILGIKETPNTKRSFANRWQCRKL